MEVIVRRDDIYMTTIKTNNYYVQDVERMKADKRIHGACLVIENINKVGTVNMWNITKNIKRMERRT